MRTLTIVLATVAALVCGGCASVPKVPTATYVSDTGERMTACFDIGAQTVTVRLPNGKEVTLPLAISASGARYSNGQETFWEHQGEATYRIGEKVVYRGKVEAQR